MSTSSSSSVSPRYDLSLNPPYQINYRAKRAGKHISASKRRITFQFGFSSARAIAAGRTEVECRGEEHEVVLIWSHVTGKRQLFMDGREIHMSKAARGNTKFEYSWEILGGHILKIIANGTPPTGEKAQWQRQFELELDGMSFFDFSKIYELGRGGNVGRRHNTASMKKELPAIGYSYRGTAYETRDDTEQEYDDDSLQQQQTHPVQEVKADLFDMKQPPSQLIVSPMSQCGSLPSLVGSITPTSSFDEFTPVEYTSNNNQRPYNAISNEILCAYGNAAPPASVNSAPSSSRALVPVSEECMDVITKSMKNLVNLDDIATTPVRPISNQASTNFPAAAKQNKQLVPSWAQVGRAPTLAEIRDSANTVQSPNAGQDASMMQPMVQQQQQYQHYAAHFQSQGYHGAAYSAAAPSYGYHYGVRDVNMQFSHA